MKSNKNEQNYLLKILFKSYILQSVLCSGIILMCTVSFDMVLTWILDRYVDISYFYSAKFPLFLFIYAILSTSRHLSPLFKLQFLHNVCKLLALVIPPLTIG